MLTEVTKIIRGLSVDAIEKVISIPATIGCAEMSSAVWRVLRHDPQKPTG